MTITDVKTYSTIHSIGFEINIEGDENHQGKSITLYRKKGYMGYREFLAPDRIDANNTYDSKPSDEHYNMFAGSIMFLEPDTEYEVLVILIDVENNEVYQHSFIQKTRKTPQKPNGRILHVVPYNENGDGSAENPYNFYDANSNSFPGDTILLHEGDYYLEHNNVSIDNGGTKNNYIVYKAVGNVNFTRIRILANYIWLEGINFIPSGSIDTYAIRAIEDVQAENVVITKCNFTGFKYSIYLRQECKYWYIADNMITGHLEIGDTSTYGEGIELSNSEGHTICYNTIRQTADGISYPKRNVDMFNNDMYDITDDCFEIDYAYSNVRVWNNRGISRYAAVSFQPLYAGPCYILFNQFINFGSEMFKLRIIDKFVVMHNIFASWDSIQMKIQQMNYGTVKNNLWVNIGGIKIPERQYYEKTSVDSEDCSPEILQANWRSAVANNGFDEAIRIHWDGNYNMSLEDLYIISGMENGSIRFNKENVFEDWNLPTTPQRVKPQTFKIKATSLTRNLAEKIPGINDEYMDSAPDLGCYEYGKDEVHYGVRG